MWNVFKPKELSEIDLKYEPSLSSLNEMNIVDLKEQFKGEVEQNKVKFPVELGEEHPFDFMIMEKLYKQFGFFTAVVDKYVDFVVGPGFYVTCDDERSKKIIDSFMTDVNFDTILRAWTKEALMKGNGFLEIGGNKKDGVKGLKLLNANYMYVVRDNKGKIKSYNQYKGAFKKFDKQKVIPFKDPDNIAHVPFNVVGDCAYGIGIGYSALQLIDNLLGMNRDMHYIAERKANSPLHAKLGKVDGNTKIIPKPSDVDAFGKKMEIMSKKTNWATDPLVDLSVVDFGKVGDKFESILKNDMELLLYSFQIPAVIMGMSNINEGIAKVQMEAFQRRIMSIQAELEKIIEQKIFKRILNANGFNKKKDGTDVHVEFEWGTPSVMEVEARMGLIAEMMKSPTISGAMNIMLENEMANLLKFDQDEWEKLKLEQEQKEEEERKRLEAQPQPIVPGQNANFPKPVAPKAKQPVQPKAENQKEIINSIKNMIEKQKEEFDKQLDNIKDELKKETDITKFKEEWISREDKILEDNKKSKESTKKELQDMKNILLQLEKTKKIKRKSIIPEKIEQNVTEDHKPLIVKVKRKKDKKNYEYEKNCMHCEESWENYNTIEEWLGFNYKKYLGHIESVLSSYGFDYIKAVNEIELEAGMLTSTQVESLRKVIDDGFKKGQGLKEMAKQVDKKVQLKDLYRMTPEGNIKLGASGLPILARSAEKRAIGIVRTEVTNLANAGAEEYYKENGIKQVKWVASYGERTCPECEALDGQIFNVGEGERPALHPLCRCTISPIVELR